MQAEEITRILIALKTKNLTVKAIEEELGFSNGLIGKAAKGDKNLSEEKFDKLQKFYNKVMEIKPPIETKQTVVTEKGELKKVPTKEAIQRLSETVAMLNKKYGEGTVMTFGDRAKTGYDVISTGSIGLDKAIGIGGLPLGRIVEIFGWESSGKSTITLNVIANAQKRGLKCLLVDAESGFDPDYAEAIGVNINEIKYCQPSSGEEGLDVAEKMIVSKDVQVVVIDSVAALVPAGELNGDMGESKMGLHARLMSQACRKLVSLVNKNNVLLIFINQFRHKIGVVFGNPEVTTGGNALQFYASIRMEVRRSTSKENSVIGEDGNKEGNATTVKVIKNKCSSPFRSATFNIIYGEGIDRIGEIFELALGSQLIKKEGKTFSINGTKLGVGEDEAKQFLNDNPEYAETLVTKIKSA